MWGSAQDVLLKECWREKPRWREVQLQDGPIDARGVQDCLRWRFDFGGIWFDVGQKGEVLSEVNDDRQQARLHERSTKRLSKQTAPLAARQQQHHEVRLHAILVRRRQAALDQLKRLERLQQVMPLWTVDKVVATCHPHIHWLLGQFESQLHCGELRKEFDVVRSGAVELAFQAHCDAYGATDH